MKRFFSKKYLFLISLVFFLILPEIAFGLNLQLNYPKIPVINKTLNEIVQLPPEEHLPNLILYLFYFILTIAGIATFVMIVWGGVQWLTSAGSPARISEAKDRLFKALLGLVIILASYLILNTISPELTIIKPPALLFPRGYSLGITSCYGTEAPKSCYFAIDPKSGLLSKSIDDCEADDLTWINEEGCVVCCPPYPTGQINCPYIVPADFIEICTDTTFCNPGDPILTPEYGNMITCCISGAAKDCYTGAASTCGNGQCNAPQDCGPCPEECPGGECGAGDRCGNEQCDLPDDCGPCPEECTPAQCELPANCQYLYEACSNLTACSNKAWGIPAYGTPCLCEILQNRDRWICCIRQSDCP